MIRVLLFVVLGYHGLAQAKVSAACGSCMSECPHATRDFKACDGGCPDVCSASEVSEYKQQVSGGEIPSGCRACMSQCPHETREMRECDRGCPTSCSKDQAAAFRKQSASDSKAGDCYSCMAECPHFTRDLKPCDSGCADVCDNKGLIKAFLKANEKAKGCGGASSIPGESGTTR